MTFPPLSRRLKVAEQSTSMIARRPLRLSTARDVAEARFRPAWGAILTLGCVALSGSGSVSTARAAEAKAEVKITFDEHVKPILRQHCLNCHNQGDKKGGLALDSYTALTEGGGSGEVVYDDGDLEGSRLWQLVNHDDQPVMPPNQDRIPGDQLSLLRRWITGGILENSGSKAKVKKKNSLAFVASSGGKPDGPPPMPVTVPQAVVTATERVGAVTAIEASPWAPLVAIAGQRQILLYHTETTELLGVLPFTGGIAQSLRFSRDGRFIVAGGGEHAVNGFAAVYDVATGERVATVGDDLDTVFDADANAAMNRIALGGPQKMLRIFDATDGDLLFDLKKHTDWIFSVAFSPDGKYVASGDRSGGLYIWEAEAGRLFLEFNDHKAAVTSLSWRDDSAVLASASEDGTVKLWSLESGKAIKTIKAHGGVMAVRFDHQGRLVTAGRDRKATLWAADGNKAKDFAALGDVVLEAAITHDGRHVVLGDWAGEIRLVSTADPKVVHDLSANPPKADERIAVIERRREKLRARLAETERQADGMKNAQREARRALDQLDAVIAAHQADADQAREAAAAAARTLAETKKRLPVRVAESRQQHDRVIAARMAHADANERANADAGAGEKANSKASAGANTDAAGVTNAALLDAEQALADRLVQIIADRKITAQAAATFSAETRRAESERGAAAQAAQRRGPLVTAVAEATEKAAAAEAKRESLRKQLETLKRRVEQIRQSESEPG